MLTRTTRLQLAVFTVLAAIALTVSAVDYARLPHLFGFGQYTVYADFTDVSGLYPHALVTYRGVDVGVVDSLDLGTAGVRVALRIDDGTRIPADTRAAIHSTSAIGEQYVELTPPDARGPFLRGGSHIPRTRTTAMPQIAPLIDSVDALLHSIPGDRLSSLVRELDVAFDGTGPRLHSLLADSRSLLAQAGAAVRPTVQLLDVLQPFLRTQQDISGTLSSSVADLAAFADQLVASNADVVRLLDVTPQFATQFSALVDDLSPTLPVLLANVLTTGNVLETYLPNIRQLLVLYPASVAALQSAFLHGRAAQSIALDFKLNVNDPPPCTTGFLPSAQHRDPSTTSQTNTPTGLYCNVAQSDPRVVRGARNFPCAGEPGYRGASPDICALEATGALPAATRVATAAYQPRTGGFVAPDGRSYTLGASPGRPVRVPHTWQQLLLSLVGK